MLRYVDHDGRLLSDGRKCLFLASEVRCGSTFVAETFAYDLHAELGGEFWDLAKEHFADVDESTPAEAVLRTWGALFLDRSGFVACKFLCKSLAHIAGWRRRRQPCARRSSGRRRIGSCCGERTGSIKPSASPWRARRGSTTIIPQPKPRRTPAPNWRPREIYEALAAVAASDVYLEVFAQQLAPERAISLTYEQFVADAAGGLDAMRRLCQFPQRDSNAPVPASKLTRTAQTGETRGQGRVSRVAAYAMAKISSEA